MQTHNNDRTHNLPATQEAGVTRYLWDPKPVQKPLVPRDLEHTPWPERSVTVVIYTLLSLEYWLSKGGLLREWIKLNLKLAVVCTLSALLVVPPVTAILEGVQDWTRLMSATMANVNVAVTRIPPIVLALATGYLAIKLIQRHRSSRRRQRHHDYDPYQ